MDRTGRYILTGAAIAFVIFMLVEAFATFGNTAGFWVFLLGSLAATMIVLIFSIFMSTKKLVPAKVKAVYRESDKKH